MIRDHVSQEVVRHWFDEAVNLPVQERGLYLERNCADPAVRMEVLSLLAFDTGAAAVPTIVREAIGAVFETGAPVPPAQRVGVYELGRLLGSGGMGHVYEAHRVDGQVRQRVAIKFAQAPAAGSVEYREAVQRRFLRERQTLASLRHPYIASLIDAGATPEGVPYAVLEQVDGVPIDRYCDGNRLDETERIRLILKVCDAVQFAHRNLILHRDIKPDNVLVTADGIPKLIDFGVAKDLGEEAMLTMSPAFTPGYASPEQARGLAGTVATDVHGLGGLLYRLLTGEEPRKAADASLVEWIKLILEEDVPRPSLFKPELKGDLENILLKALQREPNRRYGSVPELADDLTRFLEQRPVHATPDSLVYRAGRFVRRRWAPLAAAAALVFGLATATVVSVRQREQAQRQAAEMRRIAGRLLFEVHDEIEGVPGATRAREKLGATAVEYLERLERDFGRDPELKWELLNAYARLAQSRAGAAFSIGDTKSGLHFAMRALELGAAVESGSPAPDRLDKLFAVYDSLVPVFQQASRPKEQLETIERLLRLAPRLAPIRQAQAYKESGRYHEIPPPGQSVYPRLVHESAMRAAKDFERAVAILRNISREPSAPAGTSAELASTLVSLGRVQSLTGDFSGSIASLREAIRLAETNIAAQPHNARFARHAYWSHLSLADLCGSSSRFNLGRLPEAEEHYEEASKIAERLMAADPNNEMAKLDLARVYGKHGSAIESFRPAQGLELIERALALIRQTSPGNHTGLDLRLVYLTESARPLLRLGRTEQARQQIVEARRLLEEMKERGIRASENGILKAEAIRLHAGGQPREALGVAQKQLALLPQNTDPLMSENFELVDLLERMRSYAAGIDAAACASATQRLSQIWEDLRQQGPQSAFVRAQAERARRLSAAGCEAAGPGMKSPVPGAGSGERPK